MKLIIAYLPPESVESVVCALGKKRLHGLSVSLSRGFGQESGEAPNFLAFSGSQMTKKVRLEAGCHDEDMEEMLEAIFDASHTGLPGNGKVFVVTLEDVMRLKTGERGVAAIGPSLLEKDSKVIPRRRKSLKRIFQSFARMFASKSEPHAPGSAHRIA